MGTMNQSIKWNEVGDRCQIEDAGRITNPIEDSYRLAKPHSCGQTMGFLELAGNMTWAYLKM
jgi:hypothetical protein